MTISRYLIRAQQKAFVQRGSGASSLNILAPLLVLEAGFFTRGFSFGDVPEFGSSDSTPGVYRSLEDINLGVSGSQLKCRTESSMRQIGLGGEAVAKMSNCSALQKPASRSSSNPETDIPFQGGAQITARPRLSGTRPPPTPPPLPVQSSITHPAVRPPKLAASFEHPDMMAQLKKVLCRRNVQQDLATAYSSTDCTETSQGDVLNQDDQQNQVERPRHPVVARKKARAPQPPSKVSCFTPELSEQTNINVRPGQVLRERRAHQESPWQYDEISQGDIYLPLGSAKFQGTSEGSLEGRQTRESMSHSILGNTLDADAERVVEPSKHLSSRFWNAQQLFLETRAKQSKQMRCSNDNLSLNSEPNHSTKDELKSAALAVHLGGAELSDALKKKLSGTFGTPSESDWPQDKAEKVIRKFLIKRLNKIRATRGLLSTKLNFRYEKSSNNPIPGLVASIKGLGDIDYELLLQKALDEPLFHELKNVGQGLLGLELAQILDGTLEPEKKWYRCWLC
eukprot:Blabericola_migrator_1__1980@NODE_153_length_12753_cov_114_743891_g134_i0_p3_GENE_NODE_153_length_12753_cov_114_743891_g134_i0NODE_153_length_12753_cov_114_743891_g134_i0_p3_ORF_typecomplete_len510_score72_73Drf_FH1/PF06346_12/0_19Drf_FH1/PF06346_12/6_3e03_NODE_153_length_12753_cov_114_743891_g134_i013442873